MCIVITLVDLAIFNLQVSHGCWPSFVPLSIHSSFIDWTKRHMCLIPHPFRIYFSVWFARASSVLAFIGNVVTNCFRDVAKCVRCWLSIVFFPFRSFFVSLACVWYWKSVVAFNINVDSFVTFDRQTDRRRRKKKLFRSQIDYTNAILRVEFFRCLHFFLRFIFACTRFAQKFLFYGAKWQHIRCEPNK